MEGVRELRVLEMCLNRASFVHSLNSSWMGLVLVRSKRKVSSTTETISAVSQPDALIQARSRKRHSLYCDR